jgi:ankyrin repeat protein
MFISAKYLSDKYLYWWCYFAIIWLILGMLLDILGDTRGRIHYAAEKGDIEKVIQLLDKGIDPNYRKIIHSPTAIYYAATQGHREIVKILINYGADVNLGIEEDDAFNPLLAATINQHHDVIETLIEHGASGGVHLAAFYGNIDTIRAYLSQGGNIHKRCNSGLSLVHLAALNGQRDTVKFLIENNANQNAQDSKGETPVRKAIRRNHCAVVEFIIDREDLINTNEKRALLHYAASDNSTEVAKFLILRGEDVNTQINTGTPLHHAAANNSREVAEILISNGAEMDILDSFLGQAPLHRAIEWGNLEVVELLVINGANINKISRSGESPLHIALNEYNNSIFNRKRRNLYKEIVNTLRKYEAIDHNCGD